MSICALCKGTNKLHKKWTRKTRVLEEGKGGRKDEGRGDGATKGWRGDKELRQCGTGAGCGSGGGWSAAGASGRLLAAQESVDGQLQQQ